MSENKNLIDLEDSAKSASDYGENKDEDFGDMLQELRILLQGSQLLTAFLIVLPFNDGFARIDQVEKWVYFATFLCSITSLLLFSAPAAHHRIARPLPNRVQFKSYATRMIVIGLVPLSLALTLATQLVVTEVVGSFAGIITCIVVGIMIIAIWWLFPLVYKKK